MPEPGNTASATPADINQVDRSHKGEAALDAAFTAPDGERVTLASFAGKPVLLNLWATWCAPCVAEMPTLDAVAARLGDRVTVLAVSQDLEGKKAVAPFFARAGFKHLDPYVDDQAAVSIAYQANLPTTILFDAKGKELWRVTGGVDWSGAEAADILREAR